MMMMMMMMMMMKKQMIQATDWFWYLNLDFKVRKTFLSKLYELLSMNGGKIFIKWQLEILTMDNNCCLSAPSYWIYKISQLSGKSAKASQ